ncbi:MAG TPA: ABC transporter permease [Actinomycetota bacterium]
MTGLGLVVRQARFTNRAFWRNPASAFFTFAFPLMFLVIFTVVIGRGTVVVAGARIDQARYYVAAMAGFSVVTACFTNVAMSVTYQREAGILKRTRGTPLPGWAFLSGRVLHATFVAALLVVITGAFGAALYGAAVPSGAPLARFALTVVVGALAFSALGLATTALVPNADAAPAIVNAIVLPLLFISGIFFPVDDAPGWFLAIGSFFPVRPFADAMRASFYGAPFAFEWSDVLVLALWGLAGLALATRFFTWEPRR